MKKITILLFCLSTLYSLGQTPNVAFDGSKWKAPYTLNIPKGWDVERFLIPIEFAPQIPYKGIEDIRFTPGWGNATSDEYWTYAFLWYLDGKPKTNAKIIETNLTAYYTGLVGRNIAPRKIPADKLVPVKTTIKAIETETGDLKTFGGSIYMLDYMQQKPITLYCIVHLRSCNKQDKTFLFNEISPKPYTEPVWQSLHKLWTEFSCDKAAEKKPGA